MGKRYRVDFYDSFDMEWLKKDEYEFDDLQAAKDKCDEKNAKLDQNNKNCGEHWSVIDLSRGMPIYTTKDCDPIQKLPKTIGKVAEKITKFILGLEE
jgi:hypothetical protein